MTNIEKLRGKIPQNVFEELPLIIQKRNLTPCQLAHFLAQCHHESGGFKHAVENLNYSATRLQQVFPKHYQSTALAANHARKPELVGARVYANRMGNGNEQSGDGFYRRGRGYIQLTGTDNHQDFFSTMGLPADSDPELISKVYPLASAAWFFDERKVWRVCSEPTEKAVLAVTRLVNGGTIGIDDRIKMFNYYWDLLK